MKPSPKTPEMDQLLTDLFGVDRQQSILNDTCTICGKKAGDFLTWESEREYSISGMCFACQQKFFK